jgi:ribonuclease HII
MSRDTNPGASFVFETPSGQADSFHFERRCFASGYKIIGGVDEAGRGPLAGPVVAGCVVLPESCDFHRFKDSKKLSPEQREILFEYLHSLPSALVGVGIVSAEEIDRINILQASLLAMKFAIEDLAKKNSGEFPDFLLVDGKFSVPLGLPQQPLVRGESKSASIAAASIVAKVTRDRLMEEYHQTYPLYDFKQHKGYPTARHRQAIRLLGPCALHRKSFKGVREYLELHGCETETQQRALW